MSAAVSDWTGAEVEIHGRAVVVAAGPWTARSSGGRRRLASARRSPSTSSVGRRLAETAVGMRAPSGAEEDPVVGGRRFLFLAPRRDTTLLGTWYAACRRRGVRAELVARGAAALLAKSAPPARRSTLDAADVVGCQWGWLPLKAGREPGRPTALAERPRVIETTGRRWAARYLFSVEGVKFTTARRVAEDVIDRVVAACGHRPTLAGRRRSPRGRGDVPEDHASKPGAPGDAGRDGGRRWRSVFRRTAPGGRPAAADRSGGRGGAAAARARLDRPAKGLGNRTR